MADESKRMMELSFQGYNCSQILVLLALEARERSNPELVRAMSGLLAGMGCGKTCGALTGGCCLLGLYAGKADANENADPRLETMLTEFVEWFEEEFTSLYGGINCAEIVQDDARLRLFRCPDIVRRTYEKLKEILEAHNYDFAKPGASSTPEKDDETDDEADEECAL
jgi:C_GCAxxG_C_C family probable redox protein